MWTQPNTQGMTKDAPSTGSAVVHHPNEPEHYYKQRGFSLRSFAERTGMEYHMVLRFGQDREGRPKPCPRWIPLALKVIDAEAYRKPADYSLGRLSPSGTELT